MIRTAGFVTIVFFLISIITITLLLIKDFIDYPYGD
jgi:hypothetical protein